MTKLWAAALLLLLGGCLPAPPQIVTSELAFAGPSSSQTTNVPASPASEIAISSPSPVAMPDASAAASLLLEQPSEDITLYDDKGDAAEELLSEDDEEEEELLPPDPEVVEEKELLTAADLAAPDEEGETVAPEISFDFPVVMNDKVRYFVDYFSGNAHEVFQRWLERSGRYLPMMQQVFQEEGLPLDLTYLAMIESGFSNQAYSRARAAGPWQFMDGTGRLYGLKNDWWRDERRDPVKATRAAARHLKDLYAIFGDWYLAAAAYNAGAGKIQRGIDRYETRDFWQLSHFNYLAPETKQYVPKLLAAMLIAKEPEKYGFTGIAYQDPFSYETVKLPGATDIEIIADLSGSSFEAIKKLNPELKRWCSPPGAKDYEVRLPAGSGEGFLEKYAGIPENSRINYQHHTVRKGETLKSIARRYGIRSRDIQALNGISSKKLKLGADLILPFGTGGRLAAADISDRFERPEKEKSTRSYKVQKGDSLWKIARKFGVSERELRTWNGLGSKNILHPGKTLVVGGGSKPAAKKSAVAKKSSEKKTAKKQVASATKSQPSSTGKQAAKKQVASAAKKTSSPRKIVYKVQKGDTLYAIARQFKVDKSEIMGWNNLRKGHILRPGDRLTLHVAEERRS